MLQGMNGVLVLLSGTGELQCCYLGTEPALFVAPPLEVHAIDYEQAGKELLELQKVIKAHTKSNGKTVWTVVMNVLEDSGLLKSHIMLIGKYEGVSESSETIPID
jgi:Bardet-Biedl syndrome 9 protein